MKAIVLLSVLGLAASCGRTTTSYTRALASEEQPEQTEKGKRNLKIAAVVAGAAVAGCVIVGLAKKKCIPFAKKVVGKVEDGVPTNPADSPKKATPKAAEGSSSAKPKQDDGLDPDKVERTVKDSEVKEQEVQTTAESSSAKPKQDDDLDLHNVQKTTKDSEVKRTQTLRRTSKGMIKELEEAEITVSVETFEKLRKNMEEGSVLIPRSQVIGLFSQLGGDLLTEKQMEALLDAYSKGFDLISKHYYKFTDRAREIAQAPNDKGLYPTAESYDLAAQRLVEEGVFTDDVAKKVKLIYFDDWQHISEIFK